MAYTPPTTAATKMAYPVVAGVDDAVLQFWLDRVVGKDVDQSWSDTLGPDAQMAAAVHRYLRANPSTGGGDDLAGVSDFRSASFQVKFADAFVAQQTEGGWESTEAGRDYLDLLRVKAAGGIGVTSPGCLPYGDGFNGWAGQLGYPARLFP